MQRPLMVGALLTCSLTLTAASCGEKRTVQHLPTPPERLVCEAVPARPSISPEYQIDWRSVESAATVKVAVDRAKAEVAKLMGSIRNREGVIVGHILSLEGKLFTCFTNAQWRRDYEASLSRDS